MTTSEPNRNTLYTVEETAKLLGQSKSRLDGARSHGISPIPYVKLGKSIRYAYGDIIDYVESCKISH